MRRYETIFIVKPTAGDDDITGILDKVSSIITGDGGALIQVDKWGLKKLAYLINKLSQGYYVYIDYAGLPATVAEIERIFKIDDRLMKFMTVKLADACDPEAIIAELEAASQQEETTETEQDDTPAEKTVETKQDDTPAEKETVAEAAAPVEEAAVEE